MGFLNQTTPESYFLNLAAGNWTLRTTPDKAYSSVAHGTPSGSVTPVTVAVATDGGVMASTNGGVTWALVTTPITSPWQSVTFGNGRFVAVSSVGGTTRAIYSTTGVSGWTLATTPQLEFISICYGNGLFVAVALDGIMTSPDGITWTQRTMPAANDLSAVAFGNGRFVAIGGFAPANQRAMYSTDGINWSLGVTAGDRQWNAIVYGNGMFIAHDGNGALGYSSNGASWSVKTDVKSQGKIMTCKQIAYAHGVFVGVGPGTDAAGVFTSLDGFNWTVRRSPSNSQAWNSVCWGAGTFVAVSSNSVGTRAMTSLNGGLHE